MIECFSGSFSLKPKRVSVFEGSNLKGNMIFLHGLNKDLMKQGFKTSMFSPLWEENWATQEQSLIRYLIHGAKERQDVLMIANIPASFMRSKADKLSQIEGVAKKLGITLILMVVSDNLGVYGKSLFKIMEKTDHSWTLANTIHHQFFAFKFDNYGVFHFE